MAAIETHYGLYGRAKLEAFPPALAFAGNHGGRVRQICDRVAAIGADALIGTKIFLGQVPSQAVINPASTIWWGAAGTNVTLDIGDASNDDGLASDIAIASAGSSPIMEAAAISASAGKRLWELLGYETDPGGMLDLYATIATANVSAATAAFAWSLLYSAD